MATMRCKCCKTKRPSKQARVCRACGVHALWREATAEEAAQEKAEREAYNAQTPVIEALLEELLRNKPKAERIAKARKK